MAIRQRRARAVARGTYDASNNPKVSITFEPDLFERIQKHALNARITFAEAVRSLVGYAFDQLEQEK